MDEGRPAYEGENEQETKEERRVREPGFRCVMGEPQRDAHAESAKTYGGDHPYGS